jgi:translation initiation factor 2 alpha subunit (eIF-2alpha)
MGKILNYADEVGCEVLLIDSNVKALLPIVDFSRKKIKKSLASFFKINAEVPVMISQLECTNDIITFITVSTKDVSVDESNKCTSDHESSQKLLHMCKRLAHLSEGKLTEDQWTAFFRNKISAYSLADSLADSSADSSENFTYDAIANRKTFEEMESSEYIDVIRANYIKLFGIQTVTQTGKITIQSFAIDGNDLIKKTLTKIMKKFTPMEKGKVYTKEEMYHDDTLFNIDLKIVLPEFHVSVTSYTGALCKKTLTKFCKAIEEQEFDCCRWFLESS